MHSLPKFAQASSFYSELKSRVERYFFETKLHPARDRYLLLRVVPWLAAFIGLYVHLVFFTPPGPIALLECALFGAVFAGIGFNIMHDGAHGSLSSKTWVNELGAHTLNLMGGDTFLWRAKHNQIHHTYTNIDGVDDDIDIQPWLRMTVHQPRRALHRYQHFYCWGLYAFLYVFWIFIFDFQKYFAGRIGSYALPKMKARDHFRFWISKISYFTLFVGVPVYHLGFVNWLFGFSTMVLVTGFLISVVFQVAHAVRGTSFTSANGAAFKVEQEWAIHQVETTANFATRSRVVTWLTGGLNYQIEHHLFPKVSSTHYPSIQPIVRRTCEEFGVRYQENTSVVEALRSHFRHLRELART